MNEVSFRPRLNRTLRRLMFPALTVPVRGVPA